MMASLKKFFSGSYKNTKNFLSGSYDNVKYHASNFQDWITDPAVLGSIGTGAAAGLPYAAETAGGSLILGALSGAAAGNQARSERDYARKQDELNRDFSERQFEEAKRQFNVGQSNYENATQIRAADMQKVGLNPLSLGGSAQGQTASSVAGSNSASNASQMDYMSTLVQAVLGSQSNQNEARRIASEERIAYAKMRSDERIAGGHDTTSTLTTSMGIESQEKLSETNARLQKELQRSNADLSRDVAAMKADVDMAVAQLKAQTENYNQGENRKLQQALADQRADLERAFKQVDIQDSIASRQCQAAIAKMQNDTKLFEIQVDRYNSVLKSNTELAIAQLNLQWQWKKLLQEQDYDRRKTMHEDFLRNYQSISDNLHEDMRSVFSALTFGLLRFGKK